jgi:preprotein translocase subunit SecD
VSAFGLQQVLVKAIGESEIYIDLPQSDPTIVNRTISLLQQQGRFEGIVDGRVAVSNEVIMPGSIQAYDPYLQGSSVRWEVMFGVTESGALQFAEAVRGKGNYPVYMFLDRPENSAILLTKSQLLGNSTLTETEASGLLADALRKENSTIPLFIIGDWNSTRQQVASLNRSVTNRTLVSSDADPAIVSDLQAMGFDVALTDPSEMVPSYSSNEERPTVDEWRAVGLLSAPILNPDTTTGKPSRFYTISGFAPSNLPQADAYAYAQNEVKNLKSILSGGALPVHIIIGTPTTIPAPLGAEFLRYSIIAAVATVLLMVAIVSVRYGMLEIAPLILITSFSELAILVGLIGGLGTIDLAAMAGIIGAIGTGVNAQIVITDELLLQSRGMALKKRLGNAFYVIWTNALVAVIAMVPLLFFSGLIEIVGFALSIIFGVLIGAFITRPAYGAMISYVTGHKEHIE